MVVFNPNSIKFNDNPMRLSMISFLIVVMSSYIIPHNLGVYITLGP